MCLTAAIPDQADVLGSVQYHAEVLAWPWEQFGALTPCYVCTKRPGPCRTDQSERSGTDAALLLSVVEWASSALAWQF